MNQTFNFRRFSMLFKKHTVENYRTYLMSIAVLAGILLLFMGFVSYQDKGNLPQSVQFAFFMAFLLIAGCIFTSMIFNDLGDKKKAIPALTLPASSFEKYFVGWLYSFVIFQIVFVAIFYLIASIVIQIGHPTSLGSDNSVINLFSKNDFRPHPYYTFIFYTFLHAITFFGAIYFERLHFIKTAFAFFIVAFLMGLLNRPILSSMFNNQADGTSFFSPISISNGKTAYSIHQVYLQDYIGAIVLGLVVLVLWISAYYKLKEKEV